MEKSQEPSDSSMLREIESFRCDNHLQFPYYPVVTLTELNGETFVAAKNRDTILIYVLKNYTCVRTYSLNADPLPHKSSISAIQFVNP